MTHLKKEIKDNVRKKWHWTCAACGKTYPPKEHHLLTVHHTRLPVQGEHLIPLCLSCHHQAEIQEKNKEKFDNNKYSLNDNHT